MNYDDNLGGKDEAAHGLHSGCVALTEKFRT